MSVAKRGDGRFVVKFKDEEGRWKQRSFRTDEEARQFDADCQYNKMENTRLTLLEAVLVYLKNTEYAEKTIATYEFLVCGHDRQNGYHREGPAEFIADRFVDTLTRRDLENVRERCRNDGLTMTSINSYVSKLKAQSILVRRTGFAPRESLGEISATPRRKKQATDGNAGRLSQTLSCAPAVASMGSPNRHCPMSASRHIRTFPSRMVGIRLEG